MISGLTAAIAFVSVLICVVFFAYAARAGSSRGHNMALAATLLVLIGASLGVYASVGRYSDWQSARVDDTRDHRLAAKITEARRAVLNRPNSVEARKELSALYMEGGLFDESVKTLDEALQLKGADAELYGAKARALYYRDHREISPEVRLTLEKAFSLNPAEPSSRMLLAEHAFRNKDYGTAVKEWEIILKAHSAPGREAAIEKAVANARAKLAQTK